MGQFFSRFSDEELFAQYTCAAIRAGRRTLEEFELIGAAALDAHRARFPIEIGNPPAQEPTALEATAVPATDAPPIPPAVPAVNGPATGEAQKPAKGKDK